MPRCLHEPHPFNCVEVSELHPFMCGEVKFTPSPAWSCRNFNPSSLWRGEVNLFTCGGV